MSEHSPEHRGHGILARKPELMAPDADAEYFEVIEIDLNEIKEPLLACPNDPDDVRPLSEVAGRQIDEVHRICMTNIGHFRPPKCSVS